MSRKLLALCIASLALTPVARAQIIPNNSYAQTLVNTNAALQSSIRQTITAQGRTSGFAGAPAPSNYCSPVPPADLQRGMDGHVPPELQGDPRYQEWLRCHNRQATPQASVRAQPPASAAAAPGAKYPTPAVARHLPPAATDFVPALPGHPFVEQYLKAQPLTADQRGAVYRAFLEMSARIAKEARPNNLGAAMTVAICGAISLLDAGFTDADSDRYYLAINDRLGTAPEIAALSPLQKQNLSDSLILQITVAKLLADLGQKDATARGQSVEVARGMLVQLTGSPTGRLMP